MEPGRSPEHPEQLDSPQHPGGTHEASGLSRHQKRLRRQRLAKLFKRAAAQESSHSEAAEDLALEQEFEQHLHRLQQHHQAPSAAGQQQTGSGGAAANKRARHGAWEPHQAQGQPGGKRRRQGGRARSGAAASEDTLGSSAPLAVPAAQPTQALAQISDVSAPPPAGHQQAQQQQRGQQGQTAAAQPRRQQAAQPQQLRSLAPAAVGVHAAESESPRLRDWSAPAALLEAALMRQREEELAAGAASRLAGVCRLDLSAAALLIGAQMAGGASPADVDAVPVGEEAEDAGDAIPAGGRAPRRHVAVHGNYRRYYGYRLHHAAQQQQDPRLAAFERKWFARRRCMDVGCNEGLVTLALVACWQPRSMLGVDIDGALIARACRHLRDARSAAVERARLARRPGVPPEERREARATAASLAQTLFAHRDFLESEVAPGSLDTITCLSVTKWVHLNRGDAGLASLFAALWRALAPGGLLLLEPQPWSSYRAAVRKVHRDHAPPGSFFHRQHELRLRPAQFADHLCELGFRLARRFGVDASAAGFDRPLLLLRKPTSAR